MFILLRSNLRILTHAGSERTKTSKLSKRRAKDNVSNNYRRAITRFTESTYTKSAEVETRTCPSKFKLNNFSEWFSVTIPFEHIRLTRRVQITVFIKTVQRHFFVCILFKVFCVNILWGLFKTKHSYKYVTKFKIWFFL